MRLSIEELEHGLLNFAIARIDPRCEGLEWVLRNDTVCGVCPADADGVSEIALFISKNIFHAIKTKRILGNYSEEYAPSKHPGTAWSVIDAFVDGFERKGDGFVAFSGGETFYAETKILACLRAILKGKYKDGFVDIPDEFFEAIKRKTAEKP